MLTLDELKTAASDEGGVYLTHDGPERGLDINGGLEDQAVGYSARLRMQPQLQPSSTSQPQSPQIVSFSELSLMTGAADPMMNFPSGTVFTPYSLVRNISNQPGSVAPELWWMSGGSPHSAMLPPMTILPHETLNLNVPALLAAAGLKNFNGSVNLILDTKAQAGGLLMSSGSVDQKNTYVFEVLTHGVEEGAAKELCYWSTGNGDDTMLSLWNPADEPQDLAFTLFYAGGHYVYPIQMGPRETRTLNVSEILHSSIPDAEGNVIPAGITEGSAEIAGSLGEQQQILISLDAAVYNVRKATCGQVCWDCSGVASAAISPSTVLVPVGGTKGEIFYETTNTGSQFTASPLWTTSATNIATVNTNSGVVSGVSGGSFTLHAVDVASRTQPGHFCSDQYTNCPTFYPVGNAPGTSQAPTSLKFLSLTVLPDGVSGAVGCPGSAWAGIKIDIKYQVLDQQSTPQVINSSNMTPHETGTTFGGSPINGNIGPAVGYPTSGTTTAADGTFHDVPFGACLNGTFSSVTATQNITMIIGGASYAVRGQTWTVTLATLGHGTIKNTITSHGTGSDVSASR